MLSETCVSSEDLGDILVAAVEHGGVQEWGDLVHLLPAIIHTHDQPTNLKRRLVHNHQPGVNLQPTSLKHQSGHSHQPSMNF